MDSFVLFGLRLPAAPRPAWVSILVSRLWQPLRRLPLFC
jgi:hypothetical protein